MLSSEEASIQERARTMAALAAEAHVDTARYLRSASKEAWNGPTGCARWDLRMLAGHILGEAVWFPNLVRGAARGEPPLRDGTWEALKQLSPPEMADTLERAAVDVQASIDEASPEQLTLSVDLGWTNMPIWRPTYVALCEAVYHNWDARVGQDRHAVIPTLWATAVATMAEMVAPLLADPQAVSTSGTYLLDVGDGVGAVIVRVQNGRVSVRRGGEERADVTLRLTADQYDRLVYGRLPLGPALASGAVSIVGEPNRAEELNKIFAGVGGGDS